MTEISLSEQLREFTAMKFAGDCKCGKCQLVPRDLLDQTIVALAAKRLVIEALEHIGSGTKDDRPPFRAMPREEMQRLARVALQMMQTP